MATIATPKRTLLREPVLVESEVVRRVGENLRLLRDELSLIFPEREHLINQIVYALLTREHVLVFGPFGTGKSDLVTTLFTAFTNSKLFSVALTKFMTEGHIVGVPNAKKLREDGVIHHNIEGSILDSHFAELDELFDANAPLLRLLLGVLNERQFKRGHQWVEAKLHTAVGSTNGSPEEEIRKQPTLGAVIDRFIFQCRVDYLKHDASRRRMYEKYLHGEKLSVQIPYEELQQVSEIVVRGNQIVSPYFVEVYDLVIQAYRSKMKDRVVSDRRACKLLQLVEANALLFGRYDVDFDDILAIRWGLCMGGEDKEYKIFEQVATPIIEEAKSKEVQKIDEVQLTLLAELERTVPEVPKQCGDQKLVNLNRELRELQNKVSEIKPQLASTEDRQKQLLRKLDGLVADVRKRIDEPSGK